MKNRKRAEILWQLLDDIDSASDMFKPTNLKGYKAFYEYVMNKAGQRFDVFKSDGFKLYTKKEFDKLRKKQPKETTQKQDIENELGIELHMSDDEVKEYNDNFKKCVDEKFEKAITKTENDDIETAKALKEIAENKETEKLESAILDIYFKTLNSLTYKDVIKYSTISEILETASKKFKKETPKQKKVEKEHDTQELIKKLKRQPFVFEVTKIE